MINLAYLTERKVTFAKPVSYTHLDVYKRQGVAQSSAGRSATARASVRLP